MGLEFLGQYWNASARRVRLLGKGDGLVRDLTPYLPYPSARQDFIHRMNPGSANEVMLESAPFPTVQAVLQAESEGCGISEVLAPAWDRACRRGRPVSEAALAIRPHPAQSHLMACILPLRAQAFGVTYENSALEREAEGKKEDYRYVYKSLKYRGERCEVFLKGTRLSHFFGPNGNMGLRSDLTNSVDAKGQPRPRETVLAGIEPELGAVTYSNGKILGYTLCNDASGNQIENESILYLYQAKYFTASLGIGPWLWLSEEQVNPRIRFSARIWNDEDRELFYAEADSGLIGMPLRDLVAQAASHNALFPGELFATGTNVVPGNDAKVLRPGWKVEIRSERLGSFVHGAQLVDARRWNNLNYHALELDSAAHRRG